MLYIGPWQEFQLAQIAESLQEANRSNQQRNLREHRASSRQERGIGPRPEVEIDLQGRIRNERRTRIPFLQNEKSTGNVPISCVSCVSSVPQNATIVATSHSLPAAAKSFESSTPRYSANYYLGTTSSTITNYRSSLIPSKKVAREHGKKKEGHRKALQDITKTSQNMAVKNSSGSVDDKRSLDASRSRRHSHSLAPTTLSPRVPVGAAKRYNSKQSDSVDPTAIGPYLQWQEKGKKKPSSLTERSGRRRKKTLSKAERMARCWILQPEKVTSSVPEEPDHTIGDSCSIVTDPSQSSVRSSPCKVSPQEYDPTERVNRLLQEQQEAIDSGPSRDPDRHVETPPLLDSAASSAIKQGGYAGASDDDTIPSLESMDDLLQWAALLPD
jgi:hypothetical protein